MKTELRIFIPTYGRVNDQKTLVTLHPKLHQHVTLFARANEVAELQKKVKCLAGKEIPAKVKQLPEKYTVAGYISAMQYLFVTAGDDPFIYMDDDITGLRRALRFFEDTTPDQRKLVEEKSRWRNEYLTEPDQQLRLFEALLQNIQAPNVAACSPKPPFLTPAGRLMRENGIMTGQHTVMFVAFNTARIREKNIEWGKHEGADCHNAVSDSLFNLQLMNAGLDCRSDCRYSFLAVPMFGGQGGITADEGESRKQRVIEAHHQLHALFPEAVKVKRCEKQTSNADYLNIPYFFHRAKFLSKRRKELDPDGVIYEPENDMRLPEDWTAWEIKIPQEIVWPDPITRARDSQAQERRRELEKSRYAEAIKTWNQRIAFRTDMNFTPETQQAIDGAIENLLAVPAYASVFFQTKHDGGLHHAADDKVFTCTTTEGIDLTHLKEIASASKIQLVEEDPRVIIAHQFEIGTDLINSRIYKIKPMTATDGQIQEHPLRPLDNVVGIGFAVNMTVAVTVNSLYYYDIKDEQRKDPTWFEAHNELRAG